MGTLWLVLGIIVGLAIGMGYIPNQLKKKISKTAQPEKKLPEKYDIK